MWRVGLAYFLTRLLFFGVLLFSVNRSLQPNDDKLIPPFRTQNEILGKLFDRINETNEAQLVEASARVSFLNLIEKNHNPFIWAGHFLRTLLGFLASSSVIILSNLFFLLGLFELFAVVSRLTTNDVAFDTTVLLLLWPTSYELSFGSSLSLTLWLSFFAIRWAMDDRWIVTGISLGALALIDPIIFAVGALVIYYFWFFTQHYMTAQKIKRALYVFGPLALALIWNSDLVRGIGGLFSSSALLSLFHTSQESDIIKSSLVSSYLGQLIAIAVLLGGAIAAFFSNPTFLPRILPTYFFLAIVALSPIGKIASRVPLAALCLEGIASLPARPILQMIKVGFFGLSVYEILVMFGN